MENRYQRRDREGTHLLGIHVTADTHRAIKVLAAEKGITVAALLHEFIYDAFQAAARPVPPGLESTREEYRLNRRRRSQRPIGVAP